MMFTVALLGGIMERGEFMELTNGSGLGIWYAWLAVLYPLVITYYVYKKIQLKNLK